MTGDAFDPQRNVARHLFEEKKAHRVSVAKDTQPTLCEDIETLDWESMSIFPSGADL